VEAAVSRSAAVKAAAAAEVGATIAGRSVTASGSRSAVAQTACHKNAKSVSTPRFPAFLGSAAAIPNQKIPFMSLSRFVVSLCCAILFLSGLAPAFAESKSAGPHAATDSQRIADVEGYFTNTAPGGKDGTEWKGPLAGQAGPGHNTWLMISTGLVLFMTLPGLAMFYGGLVRQKNVLSIFAQCLGLAAVVTMLWWACGYSLSFAKGNGVLGNLEHAFFRGVEYEPNTAYSPWVSHNIWAIYQLTFAIITPALTIGAVAERMKFRAVMLFSVLWMFVVYFPAAHMLWGNGGAFNGIGNTAAASVKAVDFAGGIVVHMTSGWSALILCILLGKRRGFGRDQMPPHSMVLCAAGTGMLWVGWYGFNAGSAVASDRIATTAFVATTLSAAAACCVWGLIEYALRGKPSVLGLCSGAVAGLATITPASGFVTANSAVIIGLAAGVATWLACAKLKAFFGYDDALDTFGVHAVGGTLGTILVGFLANESANPNLKPLFATGKTLWVEQLKAAGVWLVWSVVASVILYFIVDKFIGCRADAEDEAQGLDLADHGEEGYIERA
jgi:Amt family ammonium transporter